MLFDSKKLLLIAGPCAIESLEICQTVATSLAQIRNSHPELQIVFKSSFDKANRATFEGKRGMGIVEGLKILKHISEKFTFPILTDVHSPDHCEQVASVADILQIPAFLCRQTDLLVAAASAGKTVNVKKGQFLSPFEMEFVVDKLRKAGAQEVWQTDRGTTFGYQNLVVDMRSFPIMKRFRTPTIMDATHAVLRPGTAGGSSGGDREFVPILARAACAAGAEGLYIETHPEPAKAFSDAATQWPLADFPKLVESCLAIWKAVRTYY